MTCRAAKPKYRLVAPTRNLKEDADDVVISFRGRGIKVTLTDAFCQSLNGEIVARLCDPLDNRHGAVEIFTLTLQRLENLCFEEILEVETNSMIKNP